jgi:hypothetical protein
LSTEKKPFIQLNAIQVYHGKARRGMGCQRNRA